MRRVRSPFVAEVIDTDVTGDTPYIVTRYVPGRTLDEVVARRRARCAGAALARLACGLAEALAAVHARRRGAPRSQAGQRDAGERAAGRHRLRDRAGAGLDPADHDRHVHGHARLPGPGGHRGPAEQPGVRRARLGRPRSRSRPPAVPPFGTGSYETIFYRIVNGQPGPGRRARAAAAAAGRRARPRSRPPPAAEQLRAAAAALDGPALGRRWRRGRPGDGGRHDGRLARDWMARRAGPGAGCGGRTGGAGAAHRGRRSVLPRRGSGGAASRGRRAGPGRPGWRGPRGLPARFARRVSAARVLARAWPGRVALVRVRPRRVCLPGAGRPASAGGWQRDQVPGRSPARRSGPATSPTCCPRSPTRPLGPSPVTAGPGRCPAATGPRQPGRPRSAPQARRSARQPLLVLATMVIAVSVSVVLPVAGTLLALAAMRACCGPASLAQRGDQDAARGAGRLTTVPPVASRASWSGR